MNAQEAELQLFQKAAQQLDIGLIDEFVNQGHHLTGAWEKSLHGTVLGVGNGTVLTGTMAYYGAIVNAGTPPDRIPFGGAPTGAKTSKYIQGLKNFWMLKGLSDEEATRAAFATARKQKTEGMPTIGSYQYSETGQRRWFIVAGQKLIDNEVGELIDNGIDNIVDTIFNETESETI